MRLSCCCCCSPAFLALMRRNLFLYRRRRLCGSCCEIFLPLLFILALWGIKQAVDNTTTFVPQTIKPTFPSDGQAVTTLSFTDYVTAIQAKRLCSGGLLGGILGTFADNMGMEMESLGMGSMSSSNYQITGIPFQGFDWQVPFVKCDSRNCQRPGEDAGKLYCEYHILAVAPSTADDAVGMERAEDFRDYIFNRYPQLLNHTQLSFDYDFVQVFESNEELEGYVTHRHYGNYDRPKVAIGIIFTGTDASNEYQYSLRINSTNYNSPETAGQMGARTTPDTSRLLESLTRNDMESCASELGAPMQGFLSRSCTGQYIYNGLLPMQRFVNDWIMIDSGAKDEGYFVSEHGVQYVSFPTREYETSGFYSVFGAFAPLLVTLGFLYPIAAIIRWIVAEKELHQKEMMKMMSVTESEIGLSWFFSFFFYHILTSIGLTVFSSLLFPSSDVVLFLIFWLFFFMSSIVFAQCMCTLSSKTTRGVLIGLLAFFSGYFITQAEPFDEGNPSAVRAIALHPLACLTYAIQEISRLEDVGIGVTAESFLVTDSPSGFTFGGALWYLLTDTLFWGCLMWYFNRVIVPDYGQALPFYFPFTMSYWCPGKIRRNHDDDMDHGNNDDIPVEQVSDALRSQAEAGTNIEIHNLEKIFKKEKKAVDKLNLSIYSGQITALLGHNGAGKTTTINLLTGAMQPTNGYAIIAGNDIRTQMKNIRQEIGVCLQHNCLFPQMTVREHLRFYCRLKGVYKKMTGKEVEASIDTSIRDVGLWDKRNTFSTRLSGGMKRKLSLAIAFCGDSKIVFLDEPTSGMDPFARRFTWNILRQYRQDRCIILTTHSMDEADILGDRIAIMAQGRLRCVGSSLFLKKSFGVGYQLTIEKKTQSGDPNEKLIADIVTSSVSEANLLSNVGTELSFQLPLGASADFVPMFQQLDNEIQNGIIDSYGVSITTLDEVFQVIARDDGHGSSTKKEEKTMFASARIGSDKTDGNNFVESASEMDSSAGVMSHMEDEKDSDSFQDQMNLEKTGLFFRHFKALFKKRAANFRRDKRAWLCTSILPSIFVLIGLLILKFASPVRDLKPVRLDLNDYNIGTSSPRNPIPFNNPTSKYACQPGTCSYQQPNIKVSGTRENYNLCGFHTRLSKGAQCTIEESSGVANQITDDGAMPFGDDVSNIQSSSRSIFQSSDSFESSQFGAFYLTHDSESVMSNNDQSMDGVSYGDYLYEQCLNQTGHYVLEEECENYRGGMGYVISYNFTALHSAPLFQSVTDEAIIRRALNNNNFKLSTTIHPLPTTAVEQGFNEASDSMTLWFLIVLSFPFISGAFATFIVNEKQSKAKHLQTVAGVKPLAYWLSTFFWDVLNYQIPLWITIILMFAFSAESLTSTERDVFHGVFWLLFWFGPAAAGLAYTISFAFTSASICNVFIIITGFIIGMGGPVISLMLRMLGENPLDPRENLVNGANIMDWVLRVLSPTFCLGKGLLFAINIDLISIWRRDLDLSAWDPFILRYEVSFLILQTFLFLALAMLIDVLSANPRAVSIWRKFIYYITYIFNMRLLLGKKDTKKVIPDDDDVIREQERIISGDTENDLIVVREMTKVYGNGTVAVNNVSYGIPPGQCFGLLGINGAGKTTTMAMLTAEFPPTEGDATLAGHSVCNEPDKTRRRIGYCPQFDAHFDNMTGREHIELYACIKGVPKRSVKEAAARKLKEVGLSEKDSDRLSSHYSGGMKRRLSLACATIGRPQIVFLDECSTGVDPVARREIWQMISDMVTGQNVDQGERTSVVLTTHSMEECEALCPRIGIMANGRLRCLGSAQHLKTKFGRGYQVEMKVKNVDTSDEDYRGNVQTLGQMKPRNISNGSNSLGSAPSGISFTLVEAKTALRSLSGNNDLSSMLVESNESAYLVYKDASSDTGVSLETLASFATCELRMKRLETFVNETFSSGVLRERQDLKARYEISSQEVRISQVFASIEANKGRLMLDDYGVSQTTLEQVFNMHAAEAEKHKKGAEVGGDDDNDDLVLSVETGNFQVAPASNTIATNTAPVLPPNVESSILSPALPPTVESSIPPPIPPPEVTNGQHSVGQQLQQGQQQQFSQYQQQSDMHNQHRQQQYQEQQHNYPPALPPTVESSILSPVFPPTVETEISNPHFVEQQQQQQAQLQRGQQHQFSHQQQQVDFHQQNHQQQNQEQLHNNPPQHHAQPQQFQRQNPFDQFQRNPFED